MNMCKSIRIFVILSIVIAFLISPATLYHTSADNDGKYLALFAEGARFQINGKEYPLTEKILLYYSNVFIPVDDVLPACGYTLGWDNSLCATVAVKDNVTSYIIMNSPVMWAGNERLEYEYPTFIYRGKGYMSISMFSDLTGYYVTVDGTLEETEFNKRDLLLDTNTDNAYRLPYENIASGNGVTMAGNFAFERVGISGADALIYADIVNTVAERLPNASVYNIVVPTSGEFYAPEQMALYQTDGIKKIYENLSEKVMPINAVKPLYKHADEKIYFGTDHHWTQRGAYYVYKAFAENKGIDYPPITDFKKADSTSFVGSFASFTRGTPLSDAIRANPELLERFIPRVNVEAVAYKDMYMQKRIGTVKPVYDQMNSYSCFLGGDNPLTVMVTNANTGKKLVIIKESFGNAFATWALENYSEVYVVDPRKFNGFGGNTEMFNLVDFYNFTRFDDLVIINYPVAVCSGGIRGAILDMVK